MQGLYPIPCLLLILISAKVTLREIRISDGGTEGLVMLRVTEGNSRETPRKSWDSDRYSTCSK